MRYTLENSFSGSKFHLFEKNNFLYIKKYFDKISIRDLHSFSKQMHFNSYNIKKLKIESANIIKINKKKNFIILKHYEGLSGSELLLQSDVQVFNFLNLFFCSYIKNLFNNLKLVKINKNIYLKKINQIQKNTHKDHNKLVKIFLKKILKLLKKIKFNIKDNNCHGDLTLSNLIVNKKNKKIVLIDFLSTYKETPLQDVCKILQDLRLYWSSRYLNQNDHLRAKIICDNIKPFGSIKKNKLRKEIYKILELEMLMTLFRILPYIKKKDIVTVDWIKTSIRKINKNFLINI